MTLTHIAGFHSLPLSLSQLNLPAVLKCGQSFRWTRIPLTSSGTAVPPSTPHLHPDCEWRLALQDRVICLRQNPTHIFYRSITPVVPVADADEDLVCLSFIRDYFQLDVDLLELYDDWSQKDPVFSGLRTRFSGIRMLRQDPWENLVSFICSANNHISRITGMVQNLCTHFSPPLLAIPGEDPSSSTTYHAFPSPEALSDVSVEAKLRELGFGYRAKYIQKTAAHLCATHTDPRAWLTSLRELDVIAARAALLELSGVGPKVADCVLLMSLDKPAVVPVDTHVLQIAAKYYGMRNAGKGNMSPAIYSQVAQRLESVWGKYAGWAHSVLFTADLRSFADFNLPSPATSATSTTSTLTARSSMTPTPMKKRKEITSDESPSAHKRSRPSVQTYPMRDSADASPSSLVERVKSRRTRSGPVHPL